jgi:hypothetical protein
MRVQASTVSEVESVWSRGYCARLDLVKVSTVSTRRKESCGAMAEDEGEEEEEGSCCDTDTSELFFTSDIGVVRWAKARDAPIDSRNYWSTEHLRGQKLDHLALELGIQWRGISLGLLDPTLLFSRKGTGRRYKDREGEHIQQIMGSGMTCHQNFGEVLLKCIPSSKKRIKLTVSCPPGSCFFKISTFRVRVSVNTRNHKARSTTASTSTQIQHNFMRGHIMSFKLGGCGYLVRRSAVSTVPLNVSHIVYILTR